MTASSMASVRMSCSTLVMAASPPTGAVACLQVRSPRSVRPQRGELRCRRRCGTLASNCSPWIEDRGMEAGPRPCRKDA